MNSNLELLRSLRQNIENEGVISHEEILNSQETVKGIIENINANLSGERSFECPFLTRGESSVEEFLGEVTRDEISVSLPDVPKQIKEQLIPRAIKDATELKCTGTFKFSVQTCVLIFSASFISKKTVNLSESLP